MGSAASDRCPAEYIAFGHRLADAAGASIRRYFRTPFAIDGKADATPVTVADREAEEAMRRLIEATYPAHGVIGEEFGRHNAGADLTWILDPIDGTGSFITGKPIFGTLIALWRGETPLLGIIDQPVTGERWIGAAGRGTTLNGAAAATRACPGLAEASLDATAPEMFAGEPGFARVLAAVRRHRWGSDCYAYAMVASGHVDLVIEAGLKVWDFATLVPVIEEAGGIVTGWQGERLRADADGRIVAAGDARVHAQVLALLNRG